MLTISPIALHLFAHVAKGIGDGLAATADLAVREQKEGREARNETLSALLGHPALADGIASMFGPKPASVPTAPTAMDALRGFLRGQEDEPARRDTIKFLSARLATSFVAALDAGPFAPFGEESRAEFRDAVAAFIATVRSDEHSGRGVVEAFLQLETEICGGAAGGAYQVFKSLAETEHYEDHRHACAAWILLSEACATEEKSWAQGAE